MLSKTLTLANINYYPGEVLNTVQSQCNAIGDVCFFLWNDYSIGIFTRDCYKICFPWQLRNVNIWNAIQWNIGNSSNIGHDARPSKQKKPSYSQFGFWGGGRRWGEGISMIHAAAVVSTNHNTKLEAQFWRKMWFFSDINYNKLNNLERIRAHKLSHYALSVRLTDL